MKKISLLAALGIALFAGNADAQLFTGNGKDTTLPKVEFGVKAGLNIQSMSGDIWDHDFHTGLNGGLFVRMFKNRIGGRAEVLVSTSKFSSPFITDSLGNKGDFSAVYIEVPVMFEFSITPWLVISGGVQYGNLLSAKSSNDVGGDIKKIFKQSEFSGVAGLEGKLPYNFSIGARYRQSFSNINNQDISGMPGSWSTQAVQVFVCYTIK